MSIIVCFFIQSPLNSSQAKMAVSSISTPQEFVSFARNATPYQVLGLTKNASETEIKKSFGKLSLKFHPDKWRDQKDIATEAFQSLVKARDALLPKTLAQEVFETPEELKRVLFLSASSGNIKKIKEELVPEFNRFGINIDARNENGWTALMFATSSNRPAAIAELVDLGADVEARDIWGNTALMWAAQDGYVASIAELVRLGADINAKNHFGQTPLIRAIDAGRPKVVAELLRLKADVNIITSEGQTVLNCIANLTASGLVTQHMKEIQQQILHAFLYAGAFQDKKFLAEAESKQEIMKFLEQFNKEKKEETIKQAK